jgi:hypothetical protein
MTSQSIKPRKMTAKEFNLEKKRWNKLKAKESLEKLRWEDKVNGKLHENSNIVDIKLNGENFIYNISKKRGSLTTKLSNALFNALHKNIEVNQSAYKKKKTETKLVSAGNVIGDAFRRRRERREFKEKRIVDSVTIGKGKKGIPTKQVEGFIIEDPEDYIMKTTSINLKLNPIYENLPNTENGLTTKIPMDAIDTTEIHPHTIFEHSVTRIEGLVTELINKILNKNHNIKAELVLTYALCSLKREKEEEQEEQGLVRDKDDKDGNYEYKQQKQYARTAAMDINKGDYKTKVNQLVANLSKKIVGSINGVENANSSDWMIKQFFKNEKLLLFKIKALRRSSCIPLPDFLNHPRSGLINIKNEHYPSLSLAKIFVFFKNG